MLNKLKIVFLLAFGLVYFSHLHAQDGQYDMSLLSFNITNGSVRAIAMQTDGKIIIGGTFSLAARNGANNLARLNNDGTFDPTFNIGFGVNNTVHQIKYLSNGKILVVGRFTQFNGQSVGRIICLLPNGDLDPNFNAGLGFDDAVESILEVNEGKFLCTGWFTYFDGIPRNYLAIITENGTLDTIFDPNIGPNNRVLTAAKQSDGKIVIGGWFTSYQGLSQNHIARIDTLGVLDTTFNIGTGFNNWVNTIAISPSGTILVGGLFFNFNGLVRPYFAALTQSGQIDFSVNTGIGFNGTVLTVFVQTNGNILIGGTFSNFNANTANNLVRLLSSGAIDPNFTTGTGTNGGVRAFYIQGNGQLLIGGAFTEYNGFLADGLLRTTNALPVFSPNLTPISTKIWPNPVNSTQNLTIETSSERGLLTIFDAMGRQVLQQAINNQNQTISVKGISAGLYYVVVQNGKSIWKEKIIIQ